MTAQKGNTTALKHGGAVAVKAIEDGREFSGVALDQQHKIEAQLDTDGLEAIVKNTAVRLQTAADLYYGALLKAADDGNLEAMDRYTQRFGWLAAAALRAWSQVKTDRKNKSNLSEVLDAYSQQSDSNSPKNGQEGTIESASE